MPQSNFRVLLSKTIHITNKYSFETVFLVTTNPLMIQKPRVYSECSNLPKIVCGRRIAAPGTVTLTAGSSFLPPRFVIFDYCFH